MDPIDPVFGEDSLFGSQMVFLMVASYRKRGELELWPLQILRKAQIPLMRFHPHDPFTLTPTPDTKAPR